MANGDGTLEFANSVALPGTLLQELSYRGLDEHPFFKAYIPLFHTNQLMGFKRPEIMDSWADKSLISYGFATCYPLVATKPSLMEAQAIHVSHDPWFQTDMSKLRERVKEWKAEGDKVLMFTTNRSAFGREINEWAIALGHNYISIHADTSSRFEVIFDVKKQLFLVQQTDAKLLQIYQGFRK